MWMMHWPAENQARETRLHHRADATIQPCVHLQCLIRGSNSTKPLSAFHIKSCVTLWCCPYPWSFQGTSVRQDTWPSVASDSLNFTSRVALYRCSWIRNNNHALVENLWGFFHREQNGKFIFSASRVQQELKMLFTQQCRRAKQASSFIVQSTVNRRYQYIFRFPGTRLQSERSMAICGLTGSSGARTNKSRSIKRKNMTVCFCEHLMRLI